MCGRFTQHHTRAQISERFALQQAFDEILDAIQPRYNIAPTQQVTAIVADDGGRRMTSFRWGLVPGWAKDAKLAAKMINARAETIADKPSFRMPLLRRRCLIPADGWYEWTQTPEGKQPILFQRKDRGLFAFAGLWDEWIDKTTPDAVKMQSCTIITTAANALTAPVHDRMPVILRPEDEARWLDPTSRSALGIVPLLTQYPDEWLDIMPVSRAVNSVRQDDASLIAALNDSPAK